MTQSGNRNRRIGLTIAAITIVLLAASSVWLLIQVDLLNGDLLAREYTIDSLEAPQLYSFEIGEHSIHNNVSSGYVHFDAIVVFNSGLNTALSWVIVIKVYGTGDTLLTTWTQVIPGIQARSFIRLEPFDVDYPGIATSVNMSLNPGLV